jgi:hypothetical protein
VTPPCDEMSFETYIQMEGEETTELELSFDELVDVALGINEPLGPEGPPLVGEEVHKKDVGKVGIS